MARKLTDEEIKKTADAYLSCDCSIRKTSQALGLGRQAVRGRLRKAGEKGYIPFSEGDSPHKDQFWYRVKIAQLKRELDVIKKENIRVEEVKKYIFEIANTEPTVPDWILPEHISKATTGVPTAPLSDIHYAEKVEAKQVMYLNAYNTVISEERIFRWVDRTIDLLTNHISEPNYPGIILPLLGDLFSGNIHEDLKTTNEIPVLVAVQQLFGILIRVIELFADKFGKVFVPCVPGNHGRLTKAVPAKNYAYENYDWHLYCLLQKHFETKCDDRVHFLVSDGEDLDYSVYGWIYRLTHGSQFRGGDGIIGPLGPIFRGDTKKKAQARDADREYDILVLAHFHRVMMLRRIMLNGSIKGFDELSVKSIFPYEPPMQGLWVTHPKWGMTFQFAVRVDDSGTRKDEGKSWVSWPNRN